jgi:hypothetical protein
MRSSVDWVWYNCWNSKRIKHEISGRMGLVKLYNNVCRYQYLCGQRSLVALQQRNVDAAEKVGLERVKQRRRLGAVLFLANHRKADRDRRVKVAIVLDRAAQHFVQRLLCGRANGGSGGRYMKIKGYIKLRLWIRYLNLSYNTKPKTVEISLRRDGCLIYHQPYPMRARTPAR